MEPSL